MKILIISIIENESIIEQLKQKEDSLLYIVNLYNKVDELTKLIYHKRVNKLNKEISNIAQMYHNSFLNNIIKNIDDKKAKNIDCTWIIKTNDLSTITLIKEKYTEVEIY